MLCCCLALFWQSLGSIAYSSTSTILAGIAIFETDRLLDERQAEPGLRLSRWMGGRCIALAWSPFSHIPCLAAAYEKNLFRLWDTHTWEQARRRKARQIDFPSWK